MEFDWDPVKARANLTKHGILFEAARAVFDDPLAIERLDDSEEYGEDRFIIVGIVQDLLLSIVYVERKQAVRLISARRASRKEQDDYFRKRS